MRDSGVHLMLVPPKELRAADFNPGIRTQAANALTRLQKSIDENGFQIFHPIIVAKDGKTIGDGHRRWTVAKNLGLEEVPVIFTDKTPEQIFTNNKTSARITGAEWMDAYRLGLGEGIPAGTLNLIKSIEKYMSLDWLVKHNISPNLHNEVMENARYCERDDTFFLRATGMWLVNQKMTRKARAFRDRGGLPMVLAANIVGNEPLA